MINFIKKKKEQTLEDAFKELSDLKKDLEATKNKLDELKKESLFFVKKIGIIRYNPFSNAGGDQSFSIAVLDGNKNGFVITSLYAQDGSRVYGKAIESGSSKHTLSEEEKQALQKALSNE